jgi:hypothetical protein
MNRKRLPFGCLNVAAAVAAMLVIAGAAAAQAQQSTDRLTCAAARQLIQRQGAALLRTSATTFDRYVASRAYCATTQITEPAWVPAADDRQCFVGYTCREPPSDPLL